MKYKISVACIFRNSAFYLKEFIEYHLLIGVEHFYLTNHLSNDHFEEILKPYIADNVVELRNLDQEFVNSFETEIHMPEINRWLETAKAETEWLALIDVDEFIMITKQNRNKKDLHSLLEHYLYTIPDCAGVALNWLMFGTGGVEKLKNTDYMLEELHYRSEFDDETNSYLKCIVIPSRTKRYEVHSCVPHDEWKFYLASGRPITGPHCKDSDRFDNMCLFHYGVGDNYYFNAVKVPFYKRYHNRDDHSCLKRGQESHFNNVSDYRMWDFVRSIREKLGTNADLQHYSNNVVYVYGETIESGKNVSNIAQFVRCDEIFISKDTNFNTIFGDVAPGKPKKLFIWSDYMSTKILPEKREYNFVARLKN